MLYELNAINNVVGLGGILSVEKCSGLEKIRQEEMAWDNVGERLKLEGTCMHVEGEKSDFRDTV